MFRTIFSRFKPTAIRSPGILRSPTFLRLRSEVNSVNSRRNGRRKYPHVCGGFYQYMTLDLVNRIKHREQVEELDVVQKHQIIRVLKNDIRNVTQSALEAIRDVRCVDENDPLRSLSLNLRAKIAARIEEKGFAQKKDKSKHSAQKDKNSVNFKNFRGDMTLDYVNKLKHGWEVDVLSVAQKNQITKILKGKSINSVTPLAALAIYNSKLGIDLNRLPGISDRMYDRAVACIQEEDASKDLVQEEDKSKDSVQEDKDSVDFENFHGDMTLDYINKLKHPREVELLNVKQQNQVTQAAENNVNQLTISAAHAIYHSRLVIDHEKLPALGRRLHGKFVDEDSEQKEDKSQDSEQKEDRSQDSVQEEDKLQSLKASTEKTLDSLGDKVRVFKESDSRNGKSISELRMGFGEDLYCDSGEDYDKASDTKIAEEQPLIQSKEERGDACNHEAKDVQGKIMQVNSGVTNDAITRSSKKKMKRSNTQEKARDAQDQVMGVDFGVAHGAIASTDTKEKEKDGSLRKLFKLAKRMIRGTQSSEVAGAEDTNPGKVEEVALGIVKSIKWSEVADAEEVDFSITGSITPGVSPGSSVASQNKKCR